jgi:hypothetical protein
MKAILYTGLCLLNICSAYISYSLVNHGWTVLSMLVATLCLGIAASAWLGVEEES